MPRAGVPNNPSGANGADDPKHGETSAAGLIHRNMGLTSAAPMPTVPGINAPRQATRRATGSQPSSTPAPAGAVAPTAPPAPLPYQARLAQAWQAVALIPGASPLVQQLAAEAANGG